MRLLRAAQRIAAALAVLACAGCATPRAADEAWPPAVADGVLQPDPSLRFGELRNGFRWIAAPMETGDDARVSLRLVVRAGSQHEFAGAEGAAHMLEHMAFRGTRRLADGDIQRRLGAYGLSLGQDLNAMTGQTATIYRIDLPRADADAMFVALNILREIAGEMRIDPAALDMERGVVLAEERARDSPDARLAEAIDHQRLGDHPYARAIIGWRDTIATMSSDDLRRYYDAWYRPERAVLVVTGRVDPAALRPVVESMFGGWRGRGPAGADPATKAHTRAAVAALVEPGAGETHLVIDWPGDFVRRRATEKDRRAQLVDMLWSTAINERLPVLLEAAGRPARNASLSINRLSGVWESVSATAAGVVDPALTARTLIEAMKQAEAFGIEAHELERAKTLHLAAAVRAESGFARTAPTRADRLVDQLLLDGSAFQSPDQESALARRLAEGVTLDEANAAMRARLGRRAHVVVAGGAGDTDMLRASVGSAVEQASSAPPTAFAARQAPVWPYADFGAPGEVTERRHIADLDVTLVRFANGLELAIRPMKTEPGRVRASLAFGDGRAGLPGDGPSVAELGLTLWAQGGLGRLSRSEQARALAADGVALNAAMGDDSYFLSGPAHVSALRRQLELMAAMMSDPGLRTEEWERQLRAAAEADALAVSTPVRALSHVLPGLLRSGDPRWTPSTVVQRAEWRAEDAAAFIAPIVAHAPIALRIIGDVEPDQAIAHVAATLGALPVRGARAADPSLRRVAFPAARDVVVVPHAGRADQAALTIAWPTGEDLLGDPQAWRVARVLAQIVQDRTTLRFRVDDSATYAPSGSAVFSRALPDFGYIALSLELPPERIDAAFAEIDTIAREIAAAPLSSEALQRVLAPEVNEARNDRRDSLSFWSANLLRVHGDPRPLALVREHAEKYAAITPKDVQEAAQRWLAPERALRVKSTAAAP